MSVESRIAETAVTGQSGKLLIEVAQDRGDAFNTHRVRSYGALYIRCDADVRHVDDDDLDVRIESQHTVEYRRGIIDEICHKRSPPPPGIDRSID